MSIATSQKENTNKDMDIINRKYNSWVGNYNNGKNSIEEFRIWFELDEERINKLEYRSVKISIVLKKCIKKCNILNKLSEPGATINHTSMCKMNISEKSIKGKKKWCFNF